MFFWDYGNAFLLEASRAGIYCSYSRHLFSDVVARERQMAIALIPPLKFNPVGKFSFCAKKVLFKNT